VRLLNRPIDGLAGRLSRHRRRPLRASWSLLLGLLVTGSLCTPRSRRAGRAERETDAEQVAKGLELFLVGCAFCHGQNGEASSSSREGKIIGPTLVGVGCRRGRLPSRHRRMPMAQPGAQVQKKTPVYTEEEVAALAAYVASLGVGPAIPDESDYSIEGLSDAEREEAIVRGGQIFLTNCTALPQLRGLRRRDAARRLRPQDPRRGAAVHLRGDADRPAGHGHLLERQPVAGGEA
jgi:ubiquinol-cytochrome c reductase cytochrome c subunit